jgi:hypothetical protein
MPSGGDGGYLALPLFTGDIGGRREGMGYGDVKYLAAWRMAWLGLPQLAYGALAALLFFFAGKQALKNPLPFGPFLAAAGLCAGGRRWLVFHFNLRLKIVLQADFANQIQLGFQPVNMAFFIGQDLNHHIAADVVMDAVGIGNGFTQIFAPSSSSRKSDCSISSTSSPMPSLPRSCRLGMPSRKEYARYIYRRASFHRWIHGTQHR